MSAWLRSGRAFIFSTICGLAACSNNLTTINLTPYGIPATLVVPQGATVKRDEAGLGVIIQKGVGFQLRIGEGKINISEIFKDVESNKINRLKQVLIKSTLDLTYASEIANRTEYHFLKNIPLGKEWYHCKEDESHAAHTQKEIEEMWVACATMK